LIPSCTEKYKGGLRPSPEELADILKKSEKEWSGGFYPSSTSLCEADLRYANLKGAKLSYANLEGAHLDGANLEGAHLNGANLEGANLEDAHLEDAHLEGAKLEGARWGGVLRHANLSGAHLGGAHLNGAELWYAHLNGANLAGAHLGRAILAGAMLQGAMLKDADLTSALLEAANLTNAELKDANLKNAELVNANLKNADLTNAKLEGANLEGANVTGADFDLLPGSLPDPLSLSSAEGLQFVQFNKEPAGLVKLRSEFKDSGLRKQESQLTYVIRRCELRRLVRRGSRLLPGEAVPLHGPVEQWVNYVLFDLTCQYGMSPERPLIIVAVLALLFSVTYVFAQILPGQHGGIWAVWEEHRIDKTEGGDDPQKLTAGFPSARPQGRLRFLNISLLAAYFSLLSALRIGWSGLNFGTWISRMQPREYELHASGWVRVVSGLQSLISVYLVALTILTYFGMPFEY